MLICHPGFSTAEKVTEISGRGVGMDVVKNAIQAIGGTLMILSEPGKGAAIVMRLPITIAIINVLMVKSGRYTLAVPLTAVERTLELNSGDIAVIDGREQFFVAGESLPLVNLSSLLGLEFEPPVESRTLHLFLTEIKGCRTGVRVDKLLGNREVFVKPLARPLSALRGVSGATITGEGEVVFIIDILNSPSIGGL
jgi:two-component system chemotaxis sensor kinase CheA